jgi:hypothetical protein
MKRLEETSSLMEKKFQSLDKKIDTVSYNPSGGRMNIVSYNPSGRMNIVSYNLYGRMNI